MSQLTEYSQGATLHNVPAPLEDFAFEAAPNTDTAEFHIETGGVVLTFTLTPEQVFALAVSAASTHYTMTGTLG